MEASKGDAPKLPNMVMCGDHPSFAKTELNVKEAKVEEKDQEKLKTSPMHTRISPTTSRTERAAEQRVRATSEHALRMIEARRRVRSLEVVQRADADASATCNRALVQAALGSFRWPPYLLCVWVIVLVVTHLLHCLVTMLERTLPNIRKFCQYFRTWTEDAWKAESDFNHRVYPVALAALTALLYCVYFGLYVLYCVAIWSIEPLCFELDEKPSLDAMEPKVTNYVDEVNSKLNTSIKH